VPTLTLFSWANILCQGGIKRIFVPSGKLIDDEPYHSDKALLHSWSLLLGPSMCIAKGRLLSLVSYFLKPSEVRMAFHLMPMCSPQISERRADNLWSSCALTE
jgi:hypothetical protein